MRFLDKFLSIHYDRTFFRILVWWETRRILYNVILFVALLIGIAPISAFTEIKPGEDTVGPLAILLFLVLCNLAYTFGWIVEIVMPKSETFAPKMFKGVLKITLIVVFLPLAIHVFGWILRGFSRT